MSIQAAVENLSNPVLIIRGPEGPLVADPLPGSFEHDKVLAWLPPLPFGNLGDPQFRADLGLKYAYVTGAMANGIASTDIVEAISSAGMLGFFGAAGLSLGRIEAAIDRLTGTLREKPFGINLIHSPNEPLHEAATVDLFLKRQIKLIEASAYLRLTLPVVKYRVAGIHRDSAGHINTPNRIIAKVSRVEVATRFMSPPPDNFLKELTQQGHITPQQAELARQIPMADDITVEADSGGHTDNRPLVTLLPTMIALRDRLMKELGYARRLRIGAAGGVATPASAAAAFAMGAAYIVTGSINQACRESGSSDVVRQMLAQAEQADVIMAPAADMFEMGVKVQVLKRGTMFAMRAAKLYELYRTCTSLDTIPAEERIQLEKNLFRFPLEEIWRQTKEYFQARDPSQISKAEADPKHQMALVFRWYLGQSSRWANAGEPTRKIDYQVWCGPSMGAFNEWTKGSFLEDWQQRKVVAVALNLLYGAALILRQHQLHLQNIHLDLDIRPVDPETILQRNST
jgi:PfaD family protein